MHNNRFSANIAKGENQRIDMEVVDGSNHRNNYQNKRNINGETRMAITTHADADLGICFKNYLDPRECEDRLARVCGDETDGGAQAQTLLALSASCVHTVPLISTTVDRLVEPHSLHRIAIR